MCKKEVMSAKQLGGALFDEETFQKIYEVCLENRPQASGSVRIGYNKMYDAFEKYLDAVQEDIFRYAYQCGYEAAIATSVKGGAA